MRLWRLILVLCCSLLPGFGNGQDLEEAAANLKIYSKQMMTSGTLAEDGVARLQAAGVRRIIDLRMAEEGVLQEQQQAQQAGIEYINIPIGSALPDDQQLARFSELMAQGEDSLTLVHCGSGNRVGTLWSMYRIEQGVEPEVAIQEGQAMGMRGSRIDAVKSWSEQ